MSSPSILALGFDPIKEVVVVVVKVAEGEQRYSMKLTPQWRATIALVKSLLML